LSQILALWSTPRSRSTAFMFMMRQRGDFECFLEPFEGSAYSSEDRIFNRLGNAPPQADNNYATILRIMVEASDRMRLFIKDHAYYVEHIADPRFLNYFQHSFLIRDPAEALPSYFHKWPDLTYAETGYEAQLRLFEKVLNETGTVPPLIDAGDLVTDPLGISKAYCDAVGIPFIERALHWQPPAENTENGPWDGGLWHQYLSTSHGFKARDHNPYPQVHENPTMHEFYERCLPAYQQLYAQRLRPVGVN
jgi:hypothetical protein